MDVYNLKEQFDNYCQIVGLDTNKVSAVQVTEIRRGFYAGVSSMLTILIEIAELSEEEGNVKLDLVLAQSLKFWKEESNGR